MNANMPASWSGSIAKAVATLAIAAIVLLVVERVFMTALPALVIILVLVGSYRLAIGGFRRRGW